MLASLTRIYTALPSAVSDRWTLLLWTLLGTLPTGTPAAAGASLRAALLTALRAGTPEQRTQAVTIALRPVQRACCLAPSGASRPTHWRQGSNGGGSGGSSTRFGAMGIGVGGTAEGAAPVASATSPGSGMLAGFSKGSDKKGELPAALAAAGDSLPLGTALDLLRAITESDPTRPEASRESLIMQLEPRLGLMSLAQQLAATPITADALLVDLPDARADGDAAGTGAAGVSSGAAGVSSGAAGVSSGAVGVSSVDEAAKSPSTAGAAEPASGATTEAGSASKAAGEGGGGARPSSLAGGSSSGTGGAGSSGHKDTAAHDGGAQSAPLLPLMAAVLARLQFLSFVAAETRTYISRVALENAWHAMPTAEAQEALLLWLPSALHSLSPDALSFGYCELLLRELRWDTLTVRQYEAFEALYRHHHVSKGSLRYAAPNGDDPQAAGGSALGFLARLWRTRPQSRYDGSAPHVLSRLSAEAYPSTLQGTQQLWLTVACAPEETARIALPLLVQLHLSPAAHLDLSVVRQELLQGCFHALQRLCAQNAPAETPPVTWRPEPEMLTSHAAKARKSAPPVRAQAQVRLLLELLDEFIRACGEARKVIPHQASWRGQSCALAVTIENLAGARDGASGVAAAAGTPTVRVGGGGGEGSAGGGVEEGSAESKLELLVHDNLTLGLLRQRLKRELVAAGMPKVSYGQLQLLRLKVNGTAHPLTGTAHPSNGSAAALHMATRQATSAAAATGSSATPFLPAGAATPLQPWGVGAVAGIQAAATTPMAHWERSAVAGNGGTGGDWVLLEGEVRTLRELGVGDGHALLARILPAASSSSLPADPSSKKVSESSSAGAGAVKGESPEGKYLSLPPVMISRSNAYMACLFEVIHSFQRCPTVVAQAWDLIMRVPTNCQSLAHLAHPESVRWEAEMAQAHTQPMKLLYSLQIARSRLLPAYLPEPHAPAISAMAQWKTAFMACGFRPLFRAFIDLGATRPRDMLHATLLATSLAIVRASLVGYLHSNQPPSATKRRTARQSGELPQPLQPVASVTSAAPRASLPSREFSASQPLRSMDSWRRGPSEVLETAPVSRTPPRPTVSAELKREGSISTAMLRGYSIRKAGSSSSSDSAFGGGNSSHPVAPAMLPSPLPFTFHLSAVLGAFGEREGGSSPGSAPNTAPNSVGERTPTASPWLHPTPPAVAGASGIEDPEAREFWELVLLLLRLMTQPRSAGAVPSELARQMALDQLKLLDAILCCHPQLLPKFLSLPELPHALSLSLLRAPHPNVRKQAALLLMHLMLEVTPPNGDSTNDTLLPQLQRLLPEAVSQPHASTEYFDLIETLVRSSSSESASALQMLPPPHIGHAAASSSSSLEGLSQPSDTGSEGGGGGGGGAVPSVARQHASLCRAVLGEMLPSLAPALGTAPARVLVVIGSRDERVTLGLLRLLDALGACSNECNALLSAHLGELISMYLVTEARAQPPTAVRHACLGMLQSACRRLPNLLAVLEPLDAIHAANRRAEWSITPSSEMRRQHAGIVNQGATCYMNATLQQLFMVPSFRDGLLAAAPPPEQRTEVLNEIQRAFAHLRDGLRPTYDAKSLVGVCAALGMTYDPSQQNDAAEFLMLLVSHLEDALKGTRHAPLIRREFGGKLAQQVIYASLLISATSDDL